MVSGMQRSPVRVLVADDQRAQLRALTRTLSRYPDLELVGTAESGEEAIALARVHEPEVVVMDADMPGMGGIEATRRLTSLLPRVRVIGYSSHVSGTWMRVAGAADYVQKTDPLDRLLEAIRGNEDDRQSSSGRD